ncbi:MAG: hypothetical protein HQL43_00425 [Alphaproteobacteria bacterium]|nr:hypothetical protein [Alphaproteobacteria bacterium]
MRSSTFNFRYAKWFALTLLAALVPIYFHFLIYAPESEDRFSADTSLADLGRITKRNNAVAFYRGECLLDQLIQPCRFRDPIVITEDDHPLKFARFLEQAEALPSDIVVSEDSSFFMFYETESETRGVIREFADSNGLKESGRMYADYFDFVRQKQDRRLANDSLFLERVKSGQANFANPEAIRQFLSQLAQRAVLRLLPARVEQAEPPTYFLRNYLNFWRTRDAANLFSAWRVYRQQFIFPDLTRTLRTSFMRLDLLQNRKPNPNYNCLFYSYAQNPPTIDFDPGRYPVIKALRRAQEKGARIHVVLMPINPEYEALCAQKFQPYYKAVADTAEMLNWPMHDLRVGSQPTLHSYGIFMDHMHVWTREHEPFYLTFTKLLSDSIGIPTQQCEPENVK